MNNIIKKTSILALISFFSVCSFASSPSYDVVKPGEYTSSLWADISFDEGYEYNDGTLVLKTHYFYNWNPGFEEEIAKGYNPEGAEISYMALDANLGANEDYSESIKYREKISAKLLLDGDTKFTTSRCVVSCGSSSGGGDRRGVISGPSKSCSWSYDFKLDAPMDIVPESHSRFNWSGIKVLGAQKTGRTGNESDAEKRCNSSRSKLITHLGTGLKLPLNLSVQMEARSSRVFNSTGFDKNPEDKKQTCYNTAEFTLGAFDDWTNEVKSELVGSGLMFQFDDISAELNSFDYFRGQIRYKMGVKTRKKICSKIKANEVENFLISEGVLSKKILPEINDLKRIK